MTVKISLVVPLKNEEGSILRLLNSISRQAAPPDEVILVDAGSSDRTVEIIKGYKFEGLDAKVLSIGPAYPGIARNEGVRRARHEMIAFTDGGIELDKDWLKELSRKFKDMGDCDVVYGYYLPRADTLFKKCLSMAIVAPARMTNEGKSRSRFIASSMMKKSAWDGAGKFPDLRAAEDRVFMESLEKKGYKTAYNPKAAVTWDIPSDYAGVFKRFSDYSYHDLLARRFRDWHIPVLRMYLMAGFILSLGAFVSSVFYFLIPAGLFARVAKKILINRREQYFRMAELPAYFVLTGILIVLIDAACLAGWVRFTKGGAAR